jgi:hypothetical protein
MALGISLGTIRNYHGNQRLMTRGPRMAELPPRLSPLTLYPNVKEQGAKRSWHYQHTISNWDCK